MVLAQQHIPMNSYEMWAIISGIVANLVLAIMNRQKAAEASEHAVVAVNRVDKAMDIAAFRVDSLESKIDDVRLTIDGGLKELLGTIRAEGHAAGVKAERMRASTVPDVTNAGPTDRHPGTPA